MKTNLTLSERQLSIYTLYAKGYCFKEIAHELDLNVCLVKNETHKAIQANKMRSGTQLCIEAFKQRLIS